MCTECRSGDSEASTWVRIRFGALQWDLLQSPESSSYLQQSRYSSDCLAWVLRNLIRFRVSPTLKLRLYRCYNPNLY